MDRLSPLREGSDALDDDVPGDQQRHVAVDASLPDAMGIDRLFGVPMADPELVTQEPGALVLSVGDPCLLQREVELQLRSQELPDQTTNLLGFRLRADEAKQEVV